MAHLGGNDREGGGENAMTWTTELPTTPGWYYRRLVSTTHEEFDIFHVYEMQWSHEPINLWMERFGEDGATPVSVCVGYEFQPVKPPDDIGVRENHYENSRY